MKVEWGPDRLSVNIVLENEDEIEYLWHLTNNGKIRSFEDYCRERHYSPSGELATKVWRAIDNIYHPE